MCAVTSALSIAVGARVRCDCLADSVVTRRDGESHVVLGERARRSHVAPGVVDACSSRSHVRCDAFEVSDGECLAEPASWIVVFARCHGRGNGISTSGRLRSSAMSAAQRRKVTWLATCFGADVTAVCNDAEVASSASASWPFCVLAGQCGRVP